MDVRKKKKRIGRPMNKLKYKCEFCKMKFRRKLPYTEHIRQNHTLNFKRKF